MSYTKASRTAGVVVLGLCLFVPIGCSSEDPKPSAETIAKEKAELDQQIKNNDAAAAAAAKAAKARH